MNGKRMFSLLLCLVMTLSMVIGSAPMAFADYSGVDYSRINYSSNGRVYPASLNFGDMTFHGTLRCTNNFDLGDVNDAIREVFERTGLKERDLVEAQKKIKAAEKDRQFTYEDGVRIATNLLQILGGGDAQDVSTFLVDGVCKILLSENKGQTFAEFVIDTVVKETEIIGSHLFWDGVMNVAFWKFFNQSFDQLVEDFDVDFGKIGKVNPISMLVETMKVSYSEYKLDKERWNRRVEAVEAKELLDAFYEAVNLVLEQKEGSSGTWTLKIVSTRDRYFSFLGSENNLQRWSCVVNMVGESTKTHTPAGVFEGSIALYAAHNMYPFDCSLWYGQFGQFKKGWLKDVLSTGFYRVTGSGSTQINRSIIMEDVSFRITSMDLIRYFSKSSKGVPMRVKFTTANFDVDEVKVSSTRTLEVKTSVGFQDANDHLAGYVIVDLALHAEGMPGGGDGIRIMRDRASGDVGMVFFGQTQTDIGPGEEAVLWDSNIWRPLEGGITLHIAG